MNNKQLVESTELYQYSLKRSLREAPLLSELRKRTATLPRSIMQISPEQGQFMALLAKLTKAKRCIEVGVFTGYSSLSVALALPKDGYLLACDIDPEVTKIAQDFWQRAGVADKIDLRIAPADETLQTLINEGQHNSFDFAFIDADKVGYHAYYESCLHLLRPGGLMLLDNMLLQGSVVTGEGDIKAIEAIDSLNVKIQDDNRVDASLLMIADGVTIIRKRE